MAKHPVPGRVKTRLAASIGADAACRLYRAFVGDLAARLAATAWPVTWAVWPPGAPFHLEVVPGASCVPQEGETLGDRMAAASARVLAVSGPAVVIIGVDAPHAPLESIAEAGAALRGGADVVVGPAEDGGYWLIGMRVPQPALFGDVAWGTSGVLQATLDRAQSLGLRVETVPATFDVDEPTDLARLRALVTAGTVVLPRTAEVLASIA